MLLDGVRVLDLSRLLPGGYCTQLMLQQGAHVLKLEPPGGDPIRALPGGPAFFDALHQGKDLMTLDLRSADGRDVFMQRVAQVDVLVEGFRPTVMERLQLGYERLAEVNPGLVYCAITGYGSGGTRASKAGHDLNYLARSGVLSLMPRIDGQPVIPGLQMADLAGGLEAAFLIASALAARARTGKGSRVEVSMTHLMKRWTVLPRAARRAGLEAIPLTGELPCYHVYRAADGFLTVAALEPEFWREFCSAIERADLLSRRFDATAIAEVQSALASRSRADWIRIFGDRDVCVEPVLTLDESEIG
jgi:crotonobetainyl-CoA:carnitine CoA-transferase CaiB-like acyl-CoA transferase